MALARAATKRRGSTPRRSSKKSSVTSISGKQSSLASLAEKKFIPPPKPVMEPEIQEIIVSEYDGDCSSSGLYDGRGRAIFSNGHVYEGEWSHGQMHGQGVLSFRGGISYEGDFFENGINGSGVYRWSNATYEGEVKDGKRHGFGRLSLPEKGIEYDGEWWMGRRHGKGILKISNSNGQETVYDGDWVDDKKHGWGRLQYTSGNVYEGCWVEDKKEGKGTMHWYDKKMEYVGEWKNHLPNGVGSHVWFCEDGNNDKYKNHHGVFVMHNRYEGMFKDGRRNGEGVLYYATGARYEGEWENDQKHGEGVFVFEDGSEFEGTFVHNKPVLQEGEKFQPLQNGKINIYVNDILCEEQDPEMAGRAVNNVLMCHNTALRNVYEKCCEMRGNNGEGHPRMSFTMLLSQFWELVRQCRLATRHMPLASIDKAVQAAIKPPPAIARRRQRVLQCPNVPWVCKSTWASHDPTVEILYTQFCEALVRVAHMKYFHLGSLDQRLHSLVDKDILPFCQKEKTPQKESPPRITTEIRTYLSSVDASLRLLFCVGSEEKASGTPEHHDEESKENPDWHAASHEHHTTHGAVVGMFHKCGMIGDTVQTADILLACNEACFPEFQRQVSDVECEEAMPQMDATEALDFYCLDTEMIYHEFVEALGFCSARVYERKHKAPPNGSGPVRNFLCGKRGLLVKAAEVYGISFPQMEAPSEVGTRLSSKNTGPLTAI